MKDIELRDVEANTKRNIKELFLKPIIVTIDGIDMFEKNEENKANRKNLVWLVN